MVQLSATKCSCIAIFVSQSSEFCHHNPLCRFSTGVYCCKRIFRYRLSSKTIGYTFVHEDDVGSQRLALLLRIREVSCSTLGSGADDTDQVSSHLPELLQVNSKLQCSLPLPS
jgi:hypothetical protein